MPRVVFDFADDMHKIFESFSNIHYFNHKGLLSKKVSLDYEIKGDQPWIDFHCSQNKLYNFSVHNLELKTFDEAIYWQMAAQSGKKAKLDGFLSSLFNFGMGNLKGYLSMPEESHKIGITINNKGRITRIQTTEEYDIGLSAFMGLTEEFLKEKKTKMVNN
ncbi:MAG: hypothetical protein AABX03_02635 [Nanoarchaeota archaeon]